MVVDLGDFSSVRAFAEQFSQEYSELDSLVLNAGIMVPPFSLTVDGIESQIAVNHFGHFLLAELMMPLLLKAAKKRGVATVVSVSSSASFGSYPEGILPTLEEMNNKDRYQRKLAYGQSKLANVLFAQELAERYKDQNILVNSCHPGAVRTELGRHMMESVTNEHVKAVIQSSFEYVFGKIAWKPEDAALTQLYAAVSPELKKAKITGKYFHPIARQIQPDPHARNMSLQKSLWKLSEEATALK
mmetsp:Transcript_4199/g.4912  ORF Transcript_4199/g.4912 Transcript_4199/m.4912 type:complete len:244 (-) Transcript_4199:57-788(-)